MSGDERERRYAALTEEAVRKQQFARRLGEKLQRARRAAGLSQDELAELANVHRTEVSQFERGARLPRVDKLWRIAQVIDPDLGELFAGLGRPAARRAAAAPGRGED